MASGNQARNARNGVGQGDGSPGMDLPNLLGQFESPELEFKQELPNPGAIAKTAAAFANGRGGYFIIGVRDSDREVIGVDPGEVFDLEGRISNIIHDLVEPPVSPRSSTLLYRKKTLFIVRIFPGSTPPYHLKSEGPLQGTYMRIGSQTRKADAAYVRELELRRQNLGFDQTAVRDAGPEELPPGNVRRFIETRHKVRGAPIVEPTEKLLVQFGALMTEGGRCHPTVGGLLLFSDAPQMRFPYARIKCARFRGTSVAEFIDQRDVEGPLDRQIEAAMAFYKANVRRGATIKGLRREERDEYPETAVREAIANAVCHRDYGMEGSDIKFAMFDDRIEITSPGALPQRMSMAMLGKGVSEARNKVIARIFREMGIIEEWGQGITRMRAAMSDWGLPEPVFVELGHFFKVVLRNAAGPKVRHPGMPDADEEKLLAVAKAEGRITTKTGTRVTGRKRPAVSRKLARLERMGLLRWIGASRNDPTGYYAPTDRER